MINIKKEDLDYPKLLANIKNAPKELYINGSLECTNMPCVTVVGSRNMSEYGKKMTKKIVKQLTLAGICIVSGLAIGIDSVAHETCLENGGKTIAVLGSGLNKIFPTQNIGLSKKIIENGGCLISEHEPDEEAKKIYFPARNRIVSGLSLGTLVIEAAYRSGTSITANFAIEQGRKVFCLPNSIGNKNSKGTINLIKKGAIMVTEGEEILYELGIIDKVEDYEDLLIKEKINQISIIENEQLKDLDEITKRIYNYIKDNGISNLEVMCNDLKINIQELNMHLTILELKGLIVNNSGNNFSICDDFIV